MNARSVETTIHLLGRLGQTHARHGLVRDSTTDTLGQKLFALRGTHGFDALGHFRRIGHVLRFELDRCALFEDHIAIGFARGTAATGDEKCAEHRPDRALE